MHTLSTMVYILNKKINGNRTIAKTSGSLQKTIGIYSNSLIQSVDITNPWSFYATQTLDLRDWWLELKQVSKNILRVWIIDIGRHTCRLRFSRSTYFPWAILCSNCSLNMPIISRSSAISSAVNPPSFLHEGKAPRVSNCLTESLLRL